jgi:hypothetical protein
LKNMVETGGRGTNDVTIRRIDVACWISKATVTYARVPVCTHARACTRRTISNTYCFSRATMIRERTSMIHYTYTVCLVVLYYHGFCFIVIICFAFFKRCREPAAINQEVIFLLLAFCSRVIVLTLFKQLSFLTL